MSTGEARSGLWGDIDAKLAADGPRGGQLWSRLSTMVDVGQYRPKLAGDIEVKQFTRRSGEPYYMLGNPRDLLFFRIGPGEYELIKLMDGTRTVKEIVLERFQDSGEIELSGVADIVRQFRTSNFFEDRHTDVVGMVGRALHPESRGHKARKFAATLSAEWNGAQRPVRWLYDHGLRWALTKPFVLLTMLLSGAGVAAFAVNVDKGLFGLTGKSLAIGFFVLLAVQYFMTFVHELGHALVLVHHGRRIKSAGFKIYFGCPAFFVDSSDGLMLEPRQRILQSFAGPYGQSIGAGLASILAWAFPEWALSETLYRYTVLAYLNIFLNCIPLLELDGYWILSDFLRAPDLRPRSMEFLQHDLIHKIRSRERFSRQEVGLLVYGVLGLIATGLLLVSGYFFWKILFGGLVISLWAGGVYTRVLLVGLGLFVLNPILRGLIKMVLSIGRRVRAAWRRVRFRLQRRWRVEAAELIDTLPLFEDVPEDVLSELAGRVRLKTVRAGQPVVRQGERADAFYVVRKGVLQVVEEDPETDDVRRILRSLARGEGFGEVGLTEAARRTATVRAVTDSEVFEIGKGAFDELLSDMVRVPEFAPTIQGIAELRGLPCFMHLEPDELAELVEHGGWVNASPGQTIVEQGQAGDAFYAIQSGQAEVLEDGVRVRTIGPGSHFGEIALLLDIPRTATVRTATPVRLFRLDRTGFDRLVKDSFRKGTLNPAVSLDRVEEH
jgi:putative peptide zinc metalloprotease protein